MRAKALKEEEKERREFYDKQKAGMKDNRAKYREKVSLKIFRSWCLALWSDPSPIFFDVFHINFNSAEIA